MQQMGAILYRCKNPNGELHVKNGYFYSQNKLITDTTNWSNAGMGHEDKSGPNCSAVNSETCLVINGNYLSDKDIFRTRILSNFTNMIRLYGYQQECGYPEYGNSWGKTYKPNKIINYSNCTCPPNSDINCINKSCSNNKNITCIGGTQASPCYGSCTVNCCLRWGQTAPTKIYTYSDIISLLAQLTNWPTFKIPNGKQPYPLGETVTIKGDKYIIDPAFNWGKGIRISDNILLKCIQTGTIDKVNLSPLGKGVGQFCKKSSIC